MNYSSYKIVCPFYKNDKNGAADKNAHIKCEGIEGYCISQYFKNNNVKGEYIARYCSDIYKHKNCAIYRAVMGKYDMELANKGGKEK